MKKLFRIATVPLSLNVLLQGQLRFLSNYFEVTAVSCPGADLDEVAAREGVRTKAVEMQRSISPLQDLFSLIKLYQLFLKEKPDVVHTITPKAGLLGMVAAKMAGVPVRMHTFTGLIFPEKNGILQRILIVTDRLLCRCATHIYPEGAGVKKDLVEYRITEKPLKIIAGGSVNGIDAEHFAPEAISERERENLKKKLGISPNDFVFIFVGRLVKDKGIEELVQAFSLFKNNGHRAVKLLLVGSLEQSRHPLSRHTLQEIERNTAIISAGFQRDVRPYLAVGDILAFPSHREGFPNAVLQAGAMGLPAIVSNISGCNEIIRDQVNGIIIPPKDAPALAEAMQEMISFPQKVSRMKTVARKMVASQYPNQYVWDALLEEYTENIKNK